MTEPRYAIYFAPEPDSALWAFGSSILGYDAATGTNCPHPLLQHVSPADLVALTAEPRRYGFHATLKAPFRLAPRWTVKQLEAALADFVEKASPAQIDGLDVTEIGSFLALTPRTPTGALRNFAQSVVEAFEPFRAELTADERARRLAAGLSDRQVSYLDKFGYPYVADEFRFHMTLTGSVSADQRQKAMKSITELFLHRVPQQPVSVGRLALFEQTSPAAQFRIRAAFGQCHPRALQ